VQFDVLSGQITPNVVKKQVAKDKLEALKEIDMYDSLGNIAFCFVLTSTYFHHFLV
jgi:hypothetical protein